MTSQIDEIENYRSEALIKFKIERNIFAESPMFFVRNVPWKVQLFFLQRQGARCYLLCEEKTEGFSCNANFGISVLGTPHQTEGIQKFGPDEKAFFWCWELPQPDELFVDNIMTIELWMTADEPEGIGFKSPKKKIGLELQPLENQVQSDSLVSLLISGDFSDVTFVIKEDGSRVKAHKNILAARSPVFARMLTSDMKEGRTSEVIIDDMRSSALNIFLRHLYSGLLDFPKVDKNTCMELVNAGNKYDLANLKEYAAMALSEFVSYENALELFIFVELHNAKAATMALRSYCGRNFYEILDTL